MKMKRHCDLCDYQKFSLEKGSICGVTNNKPNFIKTCIKINFSDKLKKELFDSILEIEYLKYIKKKTYYNVLQGVVVGLLILIAGSFFIVSFLNNNYGVSLYTLKFLPLTLGLPILTGYFFLKFSLVKVDDFKKKFRVALSKKQQVDDILKLYNQKYTYQINIDKEIHGIQEVEIDIKLI